jgi:hypothetical protein
MAQQTTAAKETVVLAFDPGYINLAYWVGKMKTSVDLMECKFPFEIIDWNVINVVNRQSSNKKQKQTPNTFQVVSNLGATLMEVPEIKEFGVTDVIIERQFIPRKRKISSDIIAHCIQTFYETNHPHLKVMEQSGNLKLNVVGRLGLCEGGKRTSDYSAVKSSGIEHCKILLDAGGEEISDFRIWFNSLQKKDDAADAMLHGCYALLTSYHFPKHYIKKNMKIDN